METTLPKPPLETPLPRIRPQLATPRATRIPNTLPPPRPLLHLPRHVGRTPRKQTQRNAHERARLRDGTADLHVRRKDGEDPGDLCVVRGTR